MNNDIIILTIEIYIAGVKNRAGFATANMIRICTYFRVFCEARQEMAFEVKTMQNLQTLKKQFIL